MTPPKYNIGELASTWYGTHPDEVARAAKHAEANGVRIGDALVALDILERHQVEVLADIQDGKRSWSLFRKARAARSMLATASSAVAKIFDDKGK